MADDDDQVHLNAERARGGSTPGISRYVLGISLALVIVLFAFIVLYGVRSG